MTILTKEIENGLVADMNAAIDNRTDFDAKVKGNIDREKQIAYTMHIFMHQVNQEMNTQEKEYKDDLEAWINSSSNRSRLVIIEANPNNLSFIARSIIKASPLERIAVVNVNDEMKITLEGLLRRIWIERETAKRTKHTNENSYFSVTQSIENSVSKKSLDVLMGPHLFKSGLDIGYEAMDEAFPVFDANIEEIFCFGDSESLVLDLQELSQKIKKGIPIFSAKASPFNNNQSIWKCACKDYATFIQKITSGKSAPEIFGEKDHLDYTNIIISSTYKDLFTLEAIKAAFKELSLDEPENLIQKDIDFIKKILFEEALYPGGISPTSLAKVVSKATSSLGSKKGVAVAKSLWWNLVSRPISSAVEVEFAIANMVADGGNDIIKEYMDKKISYKLLYEKTLNTFINTNIKKEQAIRKAIIETVNAYYSIEKKNPRIKELENGILGANSFRDLGLEATKEILDNNKKGINWLKLLPFYFGVTLVFSATSLLMLTPIPIPPVVGMILNSGFATLAVTAFVSTVASMHYQRKANQKYLTRANGSFAEANAKMSAAQKERNKAISMFFSNIIEEKQNSTARNVKRNRLKSDLSFSSENTMKSISRRKLFTKSSSINSDSRTGAISKLTQIQSQDNSGVDGTIPKGEINEDTQFQYTSELYKNQADSNKLSTEIEYKMNINAWINSSASRARMVFIEAEITNAKTLANLTFNASPLECVVITGLNDLTKNNLKEELKQLWNERLEKSQINLEQFKMMYILSRKISNEDLINKGIEQLSSDSFNQLNKEKFKRQWAKKLEKPEIYKEEYLKKYFPEGTRELKDLLNERTLTELLGPHLYISEPEVSYKNMQKTFKHFEVNLEEILCFGSSPNLSKNISELAQNIQSGIPVFSVKSEPFSKYDSGLWSCACKNPLEFIKEITSGKSSEELIGKEKDDDYENVTISHIFKTLLNLSEFTKKLNNEEKVELINIDQKDLDYFKKIMFSEALYPSNTSPNALNITISKATAKLATKAGNAVSSALKMNIVGKPKSTSVEVDFALASLTLDGGNDVVKEAIDIKNSYKTFFEKLRNFIIKTGITPAQATELAFKETIKSYHEVEKINYNIKKLVEGPKGANNWRQFGINQSNETRKKARIGVQYLIPSMPVFLAISATTAASTALDLAGVSMDTLGHTTKILSIGSFAVSTFGLTTKAYSTKKLVQANRDNLPKANYAFAQANVKMYAAQRERETQLAIRLRGATKNKIEAKKLDSTTKNTLLNNSVLIEEEKEEIQEFKIPEHINTTQDKSRELMSPLTIYNDDDNFSLYSETTQTNLPLENRLTKEETIQSTKKSGKTKKCRSDVKNMPQIPFGDLTEAEELLDLNAGNQYSSDEKSANSSIEDVDLEEGSKHESDSLSETGSAYYSTKEEASITNEDINYKDSLRGLEEGNDTNSQKTQSTEEKEDQTLSQLKEAQNKSSSSESNETKSSKKSKKKATIEGHKARKKL